MSASPDITDQRVSYEKKDYRVVFILDFVWEIKILGWLLQNNESVDLTSRRSIPLHDGRKRDDSFGHFSVIWIHYCGSHLICSRMERAFISGQWINTLHDSLR